MVARLLRELALGLLMAVALFLTIDHFTARSYVDGASMEPALRPGQLLLISRLGISGRTEQDQSSSGEEDWTTPGGWLLSRGSICVFIHPGDPARLLVKRVVGLPGEVIAIRGGVVSIDGEPLDEPYVLFRDQWTMAPRRVPLGSLFVLGDNRPASDDSRFFGPVPRSKLLGVALLRYWPLSETRLMVGR